MSQWPENGTRHSAIPRCCHTPNLEFIPERIKEMCTGHNAGGTDSAISIYASQSSFGDIGSAVAQW